MDGEKLNEMFDAADDAHCKFERIPDADRLHSSRRLCGYLKVAGLMKNPERFDVHAEHDTLYLVDADDLKELSEADVLYLSRCGVSYSDEFDCLYHFC